MCYFFFQSRKCIVLYSQSCLNSSLVTDANAANLGIGTTVLLTASVSFMIIKLPYNECRKINLLNECMVWMFGSNVKYRC